MNTRDAIIDKIRKLLRMKRGGTPDEIATALRLAQELADKHDIDIDQVNPDHEQRKEVPIGHVDEQHGARISWESRYAGLIVDEFFKVSVFSATSEDHRSYVMRFVGEDWDRQIAIYVYRFLCGHCRREWKTRRGRNRNRQAFMWGMYIGLASKLRDRQPKNTEAGIVLRDQQLARRNQYIEQRWKLTSKSVKPDAKAESAFMAGWRAGRDTEIRGGVNGGSASNTEALPTSGENKLLGF